VGRYDRGVHRHQANNTWELVPQPSDVNVVTGKWVYHHKFLPGGSSGRSKARWVIRGFTQHIDVDFGETINHVVMPATTRIVLSMALSHSWPMHQLDVKNVLLHGTLTETVYCKQPSGFIDPTHPDHV
jgi:hypothetical protein